MLLQSNVACFCGMFLKMPSNVFSCKLSKQIAATQLTISSID